MRDFKKLEVWGLSRELNKLVYSLSSGFPKDEVGGLRLEIRRSSVAVSSGIAEGYGRRRVRDFVLFLYNAVASLKRLESQIYVARDLDYLSEEDFDLVVDKIGKLGGRLSAFIVYIRDRNRI